MDAGSARCCGSSGGKWDSAEQRARVVAQVVLDEGRDEVVAVVVTRLAAQRQRVARVLAGLLEPLGHQLLLEERVRETLVHEYRGPAADAGQRADEFARSEERR